jgi:ribA/ribD-fused uncharacterized protein
MITTLSHVYFYGGLYSNWYAVRYDDIYQFHDPLCDLGFHTTESHFMYQKAFFFRDLAIATKAAAERDPKAVKELGRQVRRYNDKAWQTVRYGFMVYSNYLKFSQNPEWAAELKGTESRILVEASPYDKIWGIGLSVNEAAAGAEWQGQNLLGKALMEVRGML